MEDRYGDKKFYGNYFAVVVDNVDPEKLGRVRFAVEGICEPESDWALPVGGPHVGGSKGVGSHNPPAIGASVLAGFHGGDIDVPFFWGGWPGFGEAISAVESASPADAATKIQGYETERFLIILTSVSGSEEVLIKDKASGDFISMTPSKTTIKSSSKLVVDAPLVELGGESLTPMDGMVHGTGTDPLTGLPYWMLGSTSNVVKGKK